MRQAARFATGPAPNQHHLPLVHTNSAGNDLFNMVVDTDTTATKVLRYLNQGRRGQLTCCKLLPCWICSCGSVLHLAPAFSLYTAGLRALSAMHPSAQHNCLPAYCCSGKRVNLSSPHLGTHQLCVCRACHLHPLESGQA